MANTFTTNYGLTKPEVGGDNDQWGTHINSNLTDIDTELYNKVDKVDQKGVTHTLSFAGNNITTSTTNGFNSYVAGDRIYIANSSSNTANYGEFLVDNIVSDTELDLKKADGSSDAGFTTEDDLAGCVVYLVSIPKFTRQGLTQLAGEIKLYASVSTSVIQNLGSISYAGATRYFWLPCDGTAVSRTVYDDLFDVIGTSFGTGNGSSTFNVPDFRGRTPIGTGTGAGDASSDADGASAPSGTALTARDLGEWGGQEGYTLAEANMPVHKHDATGSVSTQPVHGGTLPGFNLGGASGYPGVGGFSNKTLIVAKDSPSDDGTWRISVPTQTLSISRSTDTAISVSDSNKGSGTALTFQQRAVPFLCVNYIIAT